MSEYSVEAIIKSRTVEQQSESEEEMMSGESPAGYAVDSSGPSGVPDVSFRHPAVVTNLTGCDANNTLGHARGSDVFNRVYRSANRQIVD